MYAIRSYYVYIHPNSSTVERPEHELKGFSKVYLEAGESKQISIPLNARSFAHFVANTDSWDVDKGSYTIQVGDSSDNLPLTATFQAKEALSLDTKTSNPLPVPVQELVKVSEEEAYAY